MDSESVLCRMSSRCFKEVPKPNHNCFKNWNKSATSIEADGVVEGFQKSIEMHNLKYNKLIGMFIYDENYPSTTFIFVVGPIWALGIFVY